MSELITGGPTAIHPIEVESYRILRSRIDLSHLAEGERMVVERVVHATADLGFATTTVCTPGAVDAGVAALHAGAAVLCDVEMVRAGITRIATAAALADPAVAEVQRDEPGLTRSAAAMRLLARRHPDGAVFVVGCAPTALFELCDLVDRGELRPALVVGLPVGFVGAAESKERLRATPVASISNIGEKGGSAVAAAAVNALVRLVAPLAPAGAAEPVSTPEENR